MRKKVTIQQIANQAGVSKFSVSRTLTGKPGVSERTRELIVHVAEQLGYYNHMPISVSDSSAARSGDAGQINKETRNRGTILVLFPNVRFQNYDSAYWGPILEGVTTQLNEYGLDILTVTEPSHDNLFSLLNPEAIRGTITVGAVSSASLFDLHKLGIPVVMIDHMDASLCCDMIFTDNQTSMRELMQLLVTKGFRSFQFVGNKTEAYSFFERWTVFRLVLEQFVIACNQNEMLLKGTFEDIGQALTDMQGTLPEVFVCMNDATALDLIEQLSRHGIKTPDECLVTGFDHINDLHSISVTVHVNKKMLGMRAVDQMLWRIANPEAPMEKKQLAAELVIRNQLSVPTRGIEDAAVSNN